MTGTMTEKRGQKQKILGAAGLIFFITLMNMFIPLSTDLYLPALPTMSAFFHVSAGLTNLTLVSFFLFYAVGTLLWGPISDKYGRKPVLLSGSAVYVAASVCCAIAPDVYVLIGARIVQGLGAGAITAVSMALIKDCFEGKRRETILALVQSMAGIAPMIAPVLGAFILTFTSWRGSFWLLAAIGALCLLLAVLYEETLPQEERYDGTILGSLGRLFVVGKNIGFLAPCVIFALYSIPFMGYIAISSYIYVDYFGLSEQLYSYFFAANACLSLIGPMLYVKFFTEANKSRFAVICLLACVVSGAMVVTIGKMAPFLFWLSFVPFSLLGSVLRPFSTGILLEQQRGDTGSASSLINGINTIFGSIGMVAASITWSNIVSGLGIMIVVASAISLLGWAALLKSSIPCRGVK